MPSLQEQNSAKSSRITYTLRYMSTLWARRFLALVKKLLFLSMVWVYYSISVSALLAGFTIWIQNRTYFCGVTSIAVALHGIEFVVSTLDGTFFYMRRPHRA